MHAPAPHAPLYAPDRKPLYLQPSQSQRVDAGPDHLLLRRDTGTPLRFPLARIARVVCNTHTHWSGHAIALCLQNAIPIIWVNGHGHALGHTSPVPARTAALETLLDSYLELKDWRPRFDNWLIHRRLHILHAWAQTQPPGLDAERYGALKRSFVQNGQIPPGFAPEGAGYSHALVAEQLARQDLHMVYWGFDGQALALGQDLAALLWGQLNLESGTLANIAGAGQLPAHLFEARAHGLALQLQGHLGSLKCHLAREVDAWQ